MSQTLRAHDRLEHVSNTLASSKSSASPDHAPYPYPVPNPTTPFWRTELHELDSHRSTAELPAETDVLIIGAGFSGAAMAYQLLDENPSPPSICILEAREACSGATGRNGKSTLVCQQMGRRARQLTGSAGGHLKPDVYFQVPKYTALFGAEAANEVAAFESSQVYAVKELVEKEQIDCEFTLTRAVDVCLDADHAAKCKAEFMELRRRNVPSVRDVFFAEGKAAEDISGVKGAKAAFTFTAGHVWPYKLVMHLLQLAVSRGANLQTHTPVLSVSPTRDSDGYWAASTPRGRVRARKIVFATNAYTASLAPQYRDKIVPVKGMCGRIAVPAAPLLPNTYSLRYAPGVYDYQITRNDGSIVIGGAKPRFWHDATHWYGVTDDATLIAPAVAHFDGYMQRRFRGWEDSGAQLDRVWTGIMGYTSDLMPHVGAVPGQPGQFIMGGFNGHGMPLIWLAAKGLARMVRDGAPFEATGIPRVFKTTLARLDSDANLILESKPQ